MVRSLGIFDAGNIRVERRHNRTHVLWTNPTGEVDKPCHQCG